MSRLSLPAPEPSVANTGRSRARSRGPGGPLPSKRLILCEDGTWLNSDSGSLQGSLNIPSNVTRISRCIKPISAQGIPQVVYYHYGVGAGGGFMNKLAGLSGAGLGEIVREGYTFLATNYTPGDELFVFGFSRGAFTARSIVGLIDQIGLLTKTGLPYLAEVFRDVQHRYDPNYVPKYPNLPFPDKPSAADPEYSQQLVRNGLTRMNIPVKVVGVWETVGALGVPKVGWLTRLGLQSNAMKEYAFYDTALGNCIEYAFQALALDERRYSFQPAVWEKLQGNHTTLTQCWFPGAHSNIGGGYNDQQIATITLAWMVGQCENLLDFNLDYVFDQWDECEEYYEKHKEKVRPWSFGEIFDGIVSYYVLGGTYIRKPGRFCVINPTNGRPTDDPLEDTHEYIHPCVRSRIKLHGPGIHDRGLYECKSLAGWKLVIENEEGSKRPDIFWRSRDKPPPGFVRELPEWTLRQLEGDILAETDRETWEYVIRPSGTRKRRSQQPRSPKPARSRSRRRDDDDDGDE